MRAKGLRVGTGYLGEGGQQGTAGKFGDTKEQVPPTNPATARLPLVQAGVEQPPASQERRGVSYVEGSGIFPKL